MRKQTFLGNLAYYLTAGLYKTLRAEAYLHPSIDPNHAFIYAFWHGKLFLPIMTVSKMSRWKKVAGLVSQSRDGEILTTWIRRLGLKTARGSSHRRGARGLTELLTLAEQGYSLGIACDGPRGPIYTAKIGSAYLSQKTGLAILPLGAAYQRAKQFQSWDKFRLPYPFSRAVIYIGEPIHVAPGSDIEEATRLLALRLNEANQKAEMILNHGKMRLPDEPMNRLIITKKTLITQPV